MAAANLAAAQAIHHGQIDESVVPGTIHLVDLDHNVRSKHSRAHQDIVLIPTPSEDPGKSRKVFKTYKVECFPDCLL